MSEMMTLREAVHLFLGDYKPTTREAYEAGLVHLVAAIGADVPVMSIHPTDVTRAVQVMKKRDIAEATYQKDLKACRSFFNWCVRLHIVERSPFDHIRIPKPKHFVRQDKAMSDDELETLLNYTIEKKKWRDHALLLFLADTGCRIGGAATLTLDDMILPQGVATVTEKGEKTRAVFFGPMCEEAVEHWLEVRPGGSGSYVFSRRGDAIKPDNLSQQIRRLCKLAGIRTLSSHSLRHRKGHQLADTVDPSTAALLLGHSDVQITLSFYYPKDMTRAEEAGRRLVWDGGRD